MSTQTQRNKAKNQSKKKITNGDLGEVDLSLISFDFVFQTNKLGRLIDFPMKMRFQTFKESKQLGDIISPNSLIPQGEKNQRFQELMEGLLISPDRAEFAIMFEQLYEAEIEEFLFQFSDAKEEARKK